MAQVNSAGLLDIMRIRSLIGGSANLKASRNVRPRKTYDEKKISACERVWNDFPNLL